MGNDIYFKLSGDSQNTKEATVYIQHSRRVPLKMRNLIVAICMLVIHTMPTYTAPTNNGTSTNSSTIQHNTSAHHNKPHPVKTNATTNGSHPQPPPLSPPPPPTGLKLLSFHIKVNTNLK